MIYTNYSDKSIEQKLDIIEQFSTACNKFELRYTVDKHSVTLQEVGDDNMQNAYNVFKELIKNNVEVDVLSRKFVEYLQHKLYYITEQKELYDIAALNDTSEKAHTYNDRYLCYKELENKIYKISKSTYNKNIIIN